MLEVGDDVTPRHPKGGGGYEGGGKLIVCTLRSQELCKCGGCIILAVKYGKKGHKLWSEITKYFGKR